MNRSQRVSYRVFIGVEIACFVLLAGGVLAVCSPLWTPGGLIGWWDGYSPDRDVLGIVWLSGSVLSVMLGIAISVVAAVVGIWVGIAAGIVGLASNRAKREQRKLTGAASVNDVVSQKSPMEP